MKKSPPSLTLALFVWIGLMASVAFAADDAKTKSKPLDDQLKESLDDELLKDLPPLRPKPSRDDAAGKKPSTKAPPSELDRKLLDDLEGEDLGAKPADPLSRIGKQMRTVEERIGRQDTSKPTQELQRQIATDIESLIKQLQDQQKKSGGGSGSKSPAGGQAAPKPSTGNQTTSGKPAKESQDRLEKATAKLDGSAQAQRLIKEVWGQLPDRVREQMQTMAEEQFLPQYEKMIEEYYRRLSEGGRAP